MTLPTGFTARHPSPSEAAAVLEVVNASEVATLGAPLFDVSDIESDWASPALDVGRDVIVVEAGDRMVAWAQVYRDRSNADVHPDFTGRGLGGALLDWMEQRMLERAAPGARVSLGQPVADNDTAGTELFRTRGYEPQWTSWVLRLPPGAELPTLAMGPKVQIRPFAADEEHAVYTVIDDAFAEWEERSSRSFADWQAETTARHDFDPTLLYVATVDGELVGACVGMQYPTEGWVEQVAVRPSHRGRGLATALLAATLGELRARGEQAMGLATDSRTGALDLYLRIGMVVDQQFTHWAKVLRDPSP